MARSHGSAKLHVVVPREPLKNKCKQEVVQGYLYLIGGLLAGLTLEYDGNIR